MPTTAEEMSAVIHLMLSYALHPEGEVLFGGAVFDLPDGRVRFQGNFRDISHGFCYETGGTEADRLRRVFEEHFQSPLYREAVEEYATYLERRNFPPYSREAQWLASFAKGRGSAERRYRDERGGARRT